MAYRFIGSLVIRKNPIENLYPLSALYCGCCDRLQSSEIFFVRNYHATRPRHQNIKPYSSSYMYDGSLSLHMYSCYYKTKNLICDKGVVHSFIPVRHFHISFRQNEKEKSVVEKAVEVMKDKQEKLVKEEKLTEKGVAKPKKSRLEKTKETIRYYIDGFLLFFKELRIACTYLWKSVVKGETLTRREQKQLSRTLADVFRMIPYLIFLIVPFFEVLIPIYLKFFPNALPSTFGRNIKPDLALAEEQLKRKQEMGKFLVETLEKISLERKKKKKKEEQSMVEEFSNFLSKVRSDGTVVSNEEILHFSKLFEDEITIDSLSRAQLQALCKVLEIKPIGTDHILRFQLDMKLRQLLVDDKLIVKEGLKTLTVAELQSANRARGMRALGVSEERLRFQLQQWLDLHLNDKVPTSLLLLSRALYLPEELSPIEQLQKTIQSLPKTATDEATMKIAEISGEKIHPGTKIDALKYEQQIIEKESQEKKDKIAEDAKKKQEHKQKEEEKVAEAIAARVAMETESITDYAPEIIQKVEEEITGVSAEEALTAEDLKEIESAIENIAMENKFYIDEAELQDLKEDVDEYKEDLEDLRSVILASGQEEYIKESKSAKRLGKHVDKMVQQLDQKINELHKERLDINETISEKEKTLIKEALPEQKIKLQQQITEKKVLVISINDLLLGLRRLQKVPDEVRLQRIVQVLDEDRDGIIDANHVLKVIKLLGQENIKLETSQVTQLINLCKKEMQIEEEEKQKEKVVKGHQKEKEKHAGKEKSEEKQTE